MTADWCDSGDGLHLIEPGPSLGQIYFAFFKPRQAKPKPKKKPPKRYRLLAKDLRDGPRVTFRISPGEAKQLVSAAKERDMSVSEMIRDALYEYAEIGEF